MYDTHSGKFAVWSINYDWYAAKLDACVEYVHSGIIRLVESISLWGYHVKACAGQMGSKLKARCE